MDTIVPVASQEAEPLSAESNYLAHFNLRLLPFENVPDPAFFFNRGEYQRVLRRITDAFTAGRGLMVVAGPIGSGKTTISQRLMENLPAGTVHLWLAEPPATDKDLLQLLLLRLGGPAEWESRVPALGALRDRLAEVHARQGRVLLVVDESHKIADECLETIRLLNNLEEGSSKLIQLLLLGQDELTGMLTRPGREALRQRIANFEVLGRMSPQQVREYVRHRLAVAGGNPSLIPDLLVEAIAEAAEGIPRLTNSLCDRALLYAFESRKPVMDVKDLLRAAEDLGLHRKAFHFIVGRESGTVQRAFDGPGPAPSPAVQPAPPPWSVPATAPPAIVTGEEEFFELMEEAPRRLAGPLVFLATAVAALATSLFFYCSRANALYGGDCLSHLVRDIFGG